MYVFIYTGFLNPIDILDVCFVCWMERVLILKKTSCASGRKDLGLTHRLSLNFAPNLTFNIIIIIIIVKFIYRKFSFSSLAPPIRIIYGIILSEKWFVYLDNNFIKWFSWIFCFISTTPIRVHFQPLSSRTFDDETVFLWGFCVIFLYLMEVTNRNENWFINFIVFFHTSIDYLFYDRIQ